MENTAMEKMIEVKNLRVSFRTNNGLVRAVRDISFTLNKGETLAIVGESGSGKSVTARAIMGIQAGNSIVESGEIFYDGRDLIKIPEDDFHQLRGNRISMVFQDPFSSLNPIMRIGKQLTEAMVLNGKANQRDARRAYNTRIRLLGASLSRAQVEGVSEKIAQVKKFTAVGSALEKAYNQARDNATTALAAFDDALIDIINGERRAVARDIGNAMLRASRSYHKYLHTKDGRLPGIMDELRAAVKQYQADGDSVKVKELLTSARSVLAKALERPTPDFFAMGYYTTYDEKANTDTDDIIKLNETMLAYMRDRFMDGFISDMSRGIRLSHTRSLESKRAAVDSIIKHIRLFDGDKSNASQIKQAAAEMAKAVEHSIDRLAIRKDSFAYTFRLSINAAVENYLRARRLSGKRHLSARDAEFLAANDVNLCRQNIRVLLTRIRDTYAQELETADEIDFNGMARQMMEVIKADASKMAYTVTKRIAKNRAIDLMEEVGIPDARARYSQFPFQFSGGMRQRIVIAIALAANPDILICDEPSTALDVTIQAQILDLINGLKKKRRLSIIFITHDLGVVANMADHIAVMYAGKIVEYGKVDEVFYEPAHPYTWALLSSMPDLDTKEKLEAIPGTPPNMIRPPKGDAFAARNKYAMRIDFEQEPPFFDITPTHKAATWLLHPDAPKVEPPRIVTERIERMRGMEVKGNE